MVVAAGSEETMRDQRPEPRMRANKSDFSCGRMDGWMDGRELNCVCASRDAVMTHIADKNTKFLFKF